MKKATNFAILVKDALKSNDQSIEIITLTPSKPINSNVQGCIEDKGRGQTFASSQDRNDYVQQHLEDMTNRNSKSKTEFPNKNETSEDMQLPIIIKEDNKNTNEATGSINPLVQQEPVFNIMKAVQNEINENRLITGLFNSRRDRQKVEERASDEQRMNYTRQMLLSKKIEPLQDHICVSEPFPIEVFPEEAQHLITSVTKSLETPPAVNGSGLLIATSIAARGNFKVHVQCDHSEPLTGYWIVALPSGKRKSAVVEFFRRPFDVFENELQSEYDRNKYKIAAEIELLKKMKKIKEKEILKEIELYSSSEILNFAKMKAQELEPIEKEIQSKNIQPRLLIDNPTSEKLAVVMSQQGEATGIFEGEPGFWKQRINESNDNIFLKGTTMESFSAETCTSDSVIMKAPALTIGSFMQVGVAEKLYSNEAFRDHGLMARILPVFGTPFLGQPNFGAIEVDNESKIWFEKKMRSLLLIERPEAKERERTFFILEMESDSVALFNKFAYEVKNLVYSGAFKNFESFGEKLAGHSVRLAGFVHLLQHDEPHRHRINANAMAAGISLARFYTAHARAAFDTERIQGYKFAQKILRWLDRHQKARFSEREAQRGIGHCKIPDVRNGLRLLEDHGYLAQHVTTESVICIVHPWYNFNTFLKN